MCGQLVLNGHVGEQFNYHWSQTATKIGRLRKGVRKAEEDDKREKAANRKKWKGVTVGAGQQYMNMALKKILPSLVQGAPFFVE